MTTCRSASTRPRALVVLNPAARRGQAPARWQRVADELGRTFAVEVVASDQRGVWVESVRRALAEGVRLFIAAGGDGTVNALVNALARARGRTPLGDIVLGAVGLGSSNDFHKPFATAIDGVPVRIGPAEARDVARARYRDERGAERERLFLVSASLGVTAAANGFFNQGDALIRGLQRWWVGGAIVYAALRAIFARRGLRARLRLAAASPPAAFSNLSVMKSPYLSGSLSYDVPVDPASGLLAVNLYESRGILALLGALVGLARGRFRGRPGAHHWMVPALEVEPDRCVDLEIDGEVVRARRVRFDVLSQRIQVCR